MLALPPVDFRAVCLVRAMLIGGKDGLPVQDIELRRWIGKGKAVWRHRRSDTLVLYT